MPIITIQQIAGRTKAQKQTLIKEITRSVVDIYKVPAEGVTIIFQDLQDDDWGRNGLLHSDRESS